MKSEFCGNLGEDEQVEGAFRQLEDFLLELANLYIHVDKVLSKEGSPFFRNFNEASYHFKVAIGAGGAPFGKDDEATTWLLSFINVGERIASHKLPPCWGKLLGVSCCHETLCEKISF